MNDLSHRITQLRAQFDTQLAAAYTAQDIDAVRVAFIGRSGFINDIMAALKELDTEGKRTFGPRINELKEYFQSGITTALTRLEQQEHAARAQKLAGFDVTAYVPHQAHGSLHPYTYITRRLEDIFVSMGFELAQGPELEQEWYNFEALNIPANHPARDMQDTLWLELPGRLMRTHTSSVQARFMQGRKPPFAIFAPGRCYRHEATDASHDYVFMQAEGLLVGKDISMSHLLGTLQVFLGTLFGKKDAKLRVRPSYFPFVEPGVEIDIQCPFCVSGCSTCKKSGWIEIVGAGLVHPAVLECFDIDTKEYSGFAFGFGLTRLTMLMYGIPDIRLLHSTSVDMLKQF